MASASDAEFVEKLRSLNFMGRRTPSKQSVDHTDTAIVTTTTMDERQDVNIAIRDAVRPHAPEMTPKYWREQRA